jgi:DNA-binding transcriptional MerR regulator
MMEMAMQRKQGALSISTKDIATYYGYSKPAIRAWALEFAEYLSPTANPGRGKNRVYTAEDLEVLDYVAQRKREQATFEQIHAELKGGARGNAPDLTESDLKLLSASEGEKRVAIEVAALQRRVVDLTEQLADAHRRASEADALKVKLATAENTVELTRQQLDEAKAALKEAQGRIESLIREAGEQYTRGVMDMLERTGHLADKPANHHRTDE